MRESSTVSEPLIALNNVEVLYADVILSLKGITLSVASGGCTVLLGPNGAGKSTTLKTVSGMLDVEEGRVSSGSVRLLGKDITGVSTEQMVGDGVVHVVEGRKVLRHMTVEQNLVVGGHRLKHQSDVQQGLERVYGLIPRLAELRTRTAGYLSGGEQQLLLIGRAMMAQPKLLMIDEPSLGLAPMMVSEIFALLAKLRTQHADGERLFAALRAGLASFQNGKISASVFSAQVEEFAQGQWDHMWAEENLVLPAASVHLHPEDWKAIAAAFHENADPRFGDHADEPFSALCTRLLNLALSNR